MAFDAFLKVDGITGESTDHKHKGEIEVLSFSWGIKQNIASSGGFARNARMKVPLANAGNTFGAMPPPTKMPPVETTRIARLPASAPYASTNIASVWTQPSQRR